MLRYWFVRIAHEVQNALSGRTAGVTGLVATPARGAAGLLLSCISTSAALFAAVRARRDPRDRSLPESDRSLRVRRSPAWRRRRSPKDLLFFPDPMTGRLGLMLRE